MLVDYNKVFPCYAVKIFLCQGLLTTLLTTSNEFVWLLSIDDLEKKNQNTFFSFFQVGSILLLNKVLINDI